jgi:hypothetical protein
MLRQKLSALLRSCSAQKAGGLPIHGKPRSAHAPRSVFDDPKTCLAITLTGLAAVLIVPSRAAGSTGVMGSTCNAIATAISRRATGHN